MAREAENGVKKQRKSKDFFVGKRKGRHCRWDSNHVLASQCGNGNGNVVDDGGEELTRLVD